MSLNKQLLESLTAQENWSETKNVLCMHQHLACIVVCGVPIKYV